MSYHPKTFYSRALGDKARDIKYNEIGRSPHPRCRLLVTAIAKE